MKRSFVPILLLFAISIQSADVLAMVKTARESQKFTPTKYWLKEGVRLDDSKDNAEAELKVLVTSREYRDEEEKVKKTKNVKEVIRVIKNLQDQGANIYKSKYSKKGNTPLHTAVNNRRFIVVKALLKIAEDEEKLKDIISMGSKGEPGKGKTPIQKAEKRAKIYKQIKEALEKAQVRVDLFDASKKVRKFFEEGRKELEIEGKDKRKEHRALLDKKFPNIVEDFRKSVTKFVESLSAEELSKELKNVEDDVYVEQLGDEMIKRKLMMDLKEKIKKLEE